MRTGNYFIDSLPRSAAERLAFQLEPVRLARGRQLYEKGQPVDAVYFPTTAVVSKYQRTDDDRAIEVVLSGREGAVGLTSAFDGRLAMHDCRTTIGGAALKIRSEFIIKIGQHEPEFEAAVIKFADGQGKQMARRILCNRYHTVEQRLCTWLLMVSERARRSMIRVTHGDAARALGVHRPTITDAMAVLSERKLLEQLTGCVDIIREEEIRELACECLSGFAVMTAAVEHRQSSQSAA
jgi:CRP-like cAMP-binding protein